MSTAHGAIPIFFWSSYVHTYVERDVRVVEDIRGLAEFDRLLGLTGALTGQEINASQLGREVGVSPDTSRRWLELMVSTDQSLHPIRARLINARDLRF